MGGVMEMLPSRVCGVVSAIATSAARGWLSIVGRCIGHLSWPVEPAVLPRDPKVT